MVKTKPPEHISAIVNSILSDRGYLAICREYDAVRKWPEIVGPRVAEATECTSVDNGVLRVRVFSAAWRQELSYMKQQILKSIRQTTSSTTIHDIVFY